MPELPEVETVARTLAPDVCGRRIETMTVLEPRSWQGGTSAAAIARHHPIIQAVSRRGKLLLLHFGGAAGAPAGCGATWPACYTREGMQSGRPPLAGSTPDEVTGLAIHLRMTGGLFPQPRGASAQKHTRLIIDLDDGTRVFFNDMRKFGSARAISGRELAAWDFWKELGPDPLEMSVEAFCTAMLASGRQIKSLLLDQGTIAGVGNIYAAESLFAAGIRPDARGCDISPERLKKLHCVLREILLEAIRECGSTISDYRNAHGDAGSFQNHFRVYGRGGLPCHGCGSILLSARIGGRGTVWCPNCQKP